MSKSSKQNVGNVSIPATAYVELVKAYGLKEKSHIMNECLRQLEATHPSEFKVSWITQWPTKQAERVAITKAIPKILWDLLSNKWSARSPSELLRYGLYVMYAKRFDQLVGQDKQLEDDVKRAVDLLKQRQEQEKALGYDPLPPVSAAFVSNTTAMSALPLEEIDYEKEHQQLAELDQQPVLPVGLTVVKE